MELGWVRVHASDKVELEPFGGFLFGYGLCLFTFPPHSSAHGSWTRFIN